jgi:epoxyqueuosine reductase
VLPFILDFRKNPASLARATFERTQKLHPISVSTSIPSQLEQIALESGFDAAGWTTAEIPQKAVEDYERWLEQGRHAGMDYLPRQLERKSNLSPFTHVLVLGISHAFAAPEKPSGGTRVGRVAKYAWTPDYHGQLSPRLERMVTAVQKLGLKAKAYVDHGPVLERMLGARAFLGWRAKSGMLVSQKWGAFLTLAVVLVEGFSEGSFALAGEQEGRGAGESGLVLDFNSSVTSIPLPSYPLEQNGTYRACPPLTPLPSYPREISHPDRCGTCTRCISSCPTNAIQNDRTIDARVCISYLTIEHRGPVAPLLRPHIGNWLFGCDVCLEVCPWSVKAGEIAQNWQPDPELVYPDLEPFFTLSSRQFEKMYAGTAFSRARRKGMARNACTVLGNSRDEQHLNLLEWAAKDEAWEVREAAAWAFSQIGGRRALNLLEGMRADADERVQERVSWALEREGG